MSRIAETKALEAYPIKEEWVGNQYGGMEDTNSLSREKYQEGYDKAIQDFLENACEWLDNFLYVEGYHDEEREDKIVDFKNYMEEEL